MRLALWQTQGFGADKAANLAALSRTARAAAAAGAELLLCPECWLGGYNVDVAAGAEPADGPSAATIAALAREHNLAIAYGYAERAEGVIYNSAAVIGPDGTLLGHYRKTHLFGDFERQTYSPGACFSKPFAYGGFNIGLLICYDVEFPEAVRATALAGADLILIPTAITPEYGVVPDCIVPARAVENQIFVTYCDHAGEENGLAYLGGSCIVAPTGRKLASAGADEALLIADLDPGLIAACATTFPYRAERRPALYRQDHQ
ncbi:MAG: carbon-nitrogen hydrolase family protein [Bryobacteraceae bacterium]|nr:carbon-nitrogen hydrolase family protein [Bryobacteraceae bacterium]